MDTLISGLASVIPFILLIGVVVMVHEFGHYLAGRAFGAAVESFAFGFGRSLVEFKDKRGTRWRINWAPLGGFVKFSGEAQAPGDSVDAVGGLVGKPYQDLHPWQRVIVSLAGPLINFLFAIAVFAAMALAFGNPKFDRISVAAIQSGSAAEAAGVMPGDVFVSAGGRSVSTPYDVQAATAYSAGDPVDFVLERAGERLVLSITPREQIRKDDRLGLEEPVGVIGVQMNAEYTGQQRVGPVGAVVLGANQTADIIGQTVKVLGRLVTGRENFDRMRGPLGIGDLADRVVDSHLKQMDVPMSARLYNVFIELAQYAALFSVSIGFFNLLPIPMLDGYSALLGLYETVFGGVLPEKAQSILLHGGLAAIGLFFIAVTWNDLKRIGVLEVFGRLLS